MIRSRIFHTHYSSLSDLSGQVPGVIISNLLFPLSSSSSLLPFSLSSFPLFSPPFPLFFLHEKIAAAMESQDFGIEIKRDARQIKDNGHVRRLRQLIALSLDPVAAS
jgi:hypothetical protein